jgi:predicted glycogen debranching enzyme
MKVSQNPPVGCNLLLHEGDTLTFELKISPEQSGKAYLRTNLYRADVLREEIIEQVEAGRQILGRSWHDIEMIRYADGAYRITLPLTETGYFSAKTLFVAEGIEYKVYWPEGDNTFIKVEPATTIGSNTIYTVFPRQFGSNKYSDNSVPEEQLMALDEQGYAVIPPSGTYRNVISELDHIICDMGFKIVQVLPVHPTPTTYARMGRFGSPFAAKDMFDVDHACAEFDTAASPMEQFGELVDAVHKRGAKIFIDLPANHTGWASQLHEHHPEWFVKNNDGSTKSPGAWGVVWADLIELDYSQKELWKYMAEVFIFWCGKGVDGFRCDAGYMIPANAWRYITARVRSRFPHTIFMLEGLGGKLETTERLLTYSNLDWAYSELFQNYTQDEITAYCAYSHRISPSLGNLVNFAETHDNNRLAASGEIFASMRTALCALFSEGGAYGITNGVEWYADKKVNVHGASTLNWGSKRNQVALIKKLLEILETHACFQAGSSMRLIQTSRNNTLALLRTASNKESVLVLCNLNKEHNGGVSWLKSEFSCAEPLFDLITGEQKKCQTEGANCLLELAAGEVIALSKSAELPKSKHNHRLRQVLRSKAMQVWMDTTGEVDCSDKNFDNMAEAMADNPEKFLTTTGCDYILWQAPVDSHRTVIVPARHFLLIKSKTPFLAELCFDDKIIESHYSITDDHGGFFAIFEPVKPSSSNLRFNLRIRLLSDKTEELSGSLLYTKKQGKLTACLDKCSDFANGDYALCSNELGGMAQVRAGWGVLNSKYDAFLAANLSTEYPVDRFISLLRMRVWLRYRDYSCEIEPACQKLFTTDMDNHILWSFDAPVGMGKIIRLDAVLDFSQTGNSECIHFSRHATEEIEDALADEEVVEIIIRPDIDARINHEVTKAYTGAENAFPSSIEICPAGFVFSRDCARLEMNISIGEFIHEPHWLYMQNLPVEQDRGLEHTSDIFSPGYFRARLGGGEWVTVAAAVNEPLPRRDVPVLRTAATLPATDILNKAIKNYVVRRDEFKTVIAGYPWFLDWGRDTLICLRGCISAGMLDDSLEIIRQFARFEKLGTLPNMIRGGDHSNRDTSDAPLWMFVAVSDLIAERGASILETDCGGRSLINVLRSIADNYISGTENGIICDRDSGLVFSPSHFTWMDTNYPAGTPREGYPVEIQALWYSALSLLAQYDTPRTEQWQAYAKKVSLSIVDLYSSEDGLSDCLHCQPGVAARDAVKDDHCRCNQLFAVTLGAITDPNLSADIIRACSKLVVPGAIRTLADKPVEYELPVYSARGELLNNPSYPYQGWYSGDEDSKRKPAYHNGTAWGWVFPSYCEALKCACGDDGAKIAGSIIASSIEVIKSGCLGHVPEIMDANSPHLQKGCGAQAWSVTELYRVMKLLNV